MKRCSDDMKLVPMDDYVAMNTADLFKTLGDPGRLKILMLLQGQEVCVHHLAETMDMSISAVSHQLRILRQQRLVKFVRDGKMNYYTLDDSHVSELIDIALLHIGHGEDYD